MADSVIQINTSRVFGNKKLIENKVSFEIPQSDKSQKGEFRAIPITITYDSDGLPDGIKLSSKTKVNEKDLAYLAGNYDQIIKG
jgi:hypothetical protein